MVKKITLNDLAAMMKEGFDEIHEKFATKEDLKAFATKEDLKAFATKEDLKAFATKAEIFGIREDLKRFATKDELDAKIDEATNKVFTKEDAVISLINEVKQELAASHGARIRQQESLDNHEVRIKSLEKVCKLTI